MPENPVINRRMVRLRLESASRDGAIEELARLLFAEGRLRSVDDFVTDVLKREEIGSTYCGNLFAIPHAASTSVLELGLCIGRTEGISWGGEGETVRLVCLLAIPDYAADDESASHQVDVLSNIATIALDDPVREAWLRASCEEDFLAPLQLVEDAHDDT